VTKQATTGNASQRTMTTGNASQRTVLKGGTVVDSRGERTADVAIEDGLVVEVGSSLSGSRNVDVSGCVVAPGFVDLHAHLREPGKEEAETIETGSRAGAKGGYTALVAMPNTDPAQDSVAVIDFVREQGKRAGLVDVVPSGCITLGRKGEALAPMAELAAAGVRIFTDDGNGVQDDLLMRRAMEYGKGLGVTLAQHCEVSSLTKSAVMNECQCCTSLGLPGWPSIAEELMVFRDIELARLTGARVHFLHLSTARSVELVRAAKRDGLPVTAEVTPHHLSLDETKLATFDTVFKVNPPLRSPNDIAALREGLRDGTIDALATDHAPHPRRDKELSLDQAPPGMLGLETALGVALSVLNVELTHLVRVMSINPARIAGISDRHGRDVQPGAPANLVVFDPNATWQVEPEHLASKSRNTPFVGMTLRGKVRHTVFDGEFTVFEGDAQR
jgi:dihydroorotase